MKTSLPLRFYFLLLPLFIYAGCKKKDAEVVDETLIKSLKVVGENMPNSAIWSVYGKLTTDGHLLIGGSETVNGINTLNLIKTSLSGEVVWKKSLDTIWYGYQASQMMDAGNEGLINEFIANQYCVIVPPKISIFSGAGSVIHSFTLLEKLGYELDDAKVNFINGQYHIIVRYHSNSGQLLQNTIYDLNWNQISTKELFFAGYGGIMNCNANHIFITTRNNPPYSKIYSLTYDLELVDSMEFKELQSFIGFDQNRFILVKSFSYFSSTTNYFLNFRNNIGQTQELMQWAWGLYTKRGGVAYSRLGNSNFLVVLLILNEVNGIKTQCLELQTPDFQNFTINTSGDALALENMKANSKFTFQHAVPDSDDSLIYLVGQWDESIALMRIKRTGEIVYWD